MADVIDTHVRELRRALRGPWPARQSVVREMRDGLYDAADAYRSAGLTDTEASRRAVDELGPPHEVAAGFRDEMAAAAGRQTAFLVLVGGAVSFVLSTIAWQSVAEEAWATGVDIAVPDAYRILASGVDLLSGVTFLAALVVLWLLGGGARIVHSPRRLARVVGWVALAFLVARSAGAALLAAYAPVPVPVPSMSTAVTALATVAIGWSAWRCTRFSSPAAVAAESR